MQRRYFHHAPTIACAPSTFPSAASDRNDTGYLQSRRPLQKKVSTQTDWTHPRPSFAPEWYPNLRSYKITSNHLRPASAEGHLSSAQRFLVCLFQVRALLFFEFDPHYHHHRHQTDLDQKFVWDQILVEWKQQQILNIRYHCMICWNLILMSLISSPIRVLCSNTTLIYALKTLCS